MKLSPKIRAEELSSKITTSFSSFSLLSSLVSAGPLLLTLLTYGAWFALDPPDDPPDEPPELPPEDDAAAAGSKVRPLVETTVPRSFGVVSATVAEPAVKLCWNSVVASSDVSAIKVSIEASVCRLLRLEIVVYLQKLIWEKNLSW